MFKKHIRKLLERLPHTTKGSVERFYLARREKFSILIHHIIADDDVETFHDHPWNGFSIILGSYWEETLDGPLVKKTLFNKIVSTKYHRVELKGKPVWTIFFHGPRLKGWEFFDKKYNVRIKMDWTHDNQKN